MGSSFARARTSVFLGGRPVDPSLERGNRARRRSHIKARHRATGEPAGTSHRKPVLDPASGRVGLLWTAGSDHIGGGDLLATSLGRVTQAWSLTATRPFQY
jgi:hypothetical protein